MEEILHQKNHQYLSHHVDTVTSGARLQVAIFGVGPLLSPRSVELVVSTSGGQSASSFLPKHEHDHTGGPPATACCGALPSSLL